MPRLDTYTYNGPVDCSIPINTDKLKGKSVVVTGGANGMGERFVREFVSVGAFVTFGDLNEQRGKELEAELSSEKCRFVRCNVTDWHDQVNMFETAIITSPSKSCDIVIANAGISRSSTDSLWDLDDPDAAPVKPDLKIVDVNINGTLFTFKLAVHYFRKQSDDEDRDRCFIITGSMVAWIDSPVRQTLLRHSHTHLHGFEQANWQYTISKYGLRGLMRTVRRNSWEQGIRINYVAPCYISSAIRSAEYEKWLIDQGVQFASQQDVANCMMRIASDRTINGHSLMIVPKTENPAGYRDVEDDDYTEPGYFRHMQETQLRIIKDSWVEGTSAQGRS